MMIMNRSLYIVFILSLQTAFLLIGAGRAAAGQAGAQLNTVQSSELVDNAQVLLVFSGTDDPIAVVVKRTLTEAYQRIGIQIETRTFPAQRALVMSNNGMVDGEQARVMGIEKEYPNLIMVPVAVYVIEGVVFTKDSTIRIAGWDSLKPYNIGIRRGTVFAERGTQGMNVFPSKNNNVLFLKLGSGRVDIVVTNRIVGLDQINQLQLQGITVLEPPLVAKNLYHYLHKKNEHLLPEITKALQQMEAEGRIQAIREQTITELLRKRGIKDQ